MGNEESVSTDLIIILRFQIISYILQLFGFDSIIRYFPLFMLIFDCVLPEPEKKIGGNPIMCMIYVITHLLFSCIRFGFEFLIHLKLLSFIFFVCILGCNCSFGMMIGFQG